MASRKLKKQMLDFVVGGLEGSLQDGGLIIPRSREVLPGIETSYVLVGNSGIVLLVDKEYKNDSFSVLYEKAQKQTQGNVGVLFLKDGRTFFRSAAQKIHFKSKEGLSLKKYSPDQIGKMILLRPEEISVSQTGKELQYYQPSSEKLKEGIDSFVFQPVRYDYSHLDSRSGFKPNDTYSERIFLWNLRSHLDSPFKFEKSFIVSRNNQ